MEVGFELLQGLRPELHRIAQGVYPASPMEIQGRNFLGGGVEGKTLIDFEGRHWGEETGLERSFSVQAVLSQPPEDPQWSRDQLELIFQPSWVGIEPGWIQGRLRAINEGPGWREVSDWLEVELDLLPPLFEYVDPAASRGQAIRILGQGFLGGFMGGNSVFLLSGEFQGALGNRPIQDLEITPTWISGQEMVFSLQVHYDYSCESEDLGSEPGLLIGQATPEIHWEEQHIRGAPLEMRFEVLSSKQVIWLRFLPAFTDSLRLFGLRNYSRELQARVVEIVRRDYEGINVDIRLIEPHDFLEYAIVEVGGPDPNAQQLFGLDNTPGMDHCNQRLDDNLAGQNADGGGAYGGIFVESFLQLSPKRGESSNPLAHTLFDQTFHPLFERAAEPGEYPEGERSALIREAIRVLGNLVGNTVTHEVGHSLGLSVVPGCGQFHNGDGPNQIMDCGGDRPFEERAEIPEENRQRWTPSNRAYLERILPLR